jgi:hypothetical protein
MQIRTRLTLQFIIVVSLIIALSFGIIYYSSSIHRYNEFYHRLESKANATLAMFLNDKKMDLPCSFFLTEVKKINFKAKT